MVDDRSVPNPKPKPEAGDDNVIPFPSNKYLLPTIDLKTLPISLIKFPALKHTIPEREWTCIGVPEFTEEVSPDPTPMIYYKKSVPYYIAGTLKMAELVGQTREQALREQRSTIGKQRSNGHIASLGPAFFLDHDGDVFALEPRLRQFGVAAVIFSSHSYGFVKEGATAPSLGGRVAVFLNRPVTSREYGAVWDAINHLFGGNFDDHGRSISLCYGRHVRRSVDAPYKRVIIQGAALNTDALIELGQSLRPYPAPKEPAPGEHASKHVLIEEIVRTRLMCAVRPPDEYGEWYPMAAACKRAFPNDQEAAFQCFDVGSACSSKYGGSDVARKKFDEVPAEYHGDAKEVTLEMLHWRARRRAEKVLMALYPPQIAPEHARLGFENLGENLEGICRKGDEPIPPGSVGPEDGLKALKYILYCWNEEVLAALQPIAIPQRVLEEARRQTEKLRDRIELGGRVLHKWGGANLATDTAALADAIIDASKLFFKVDRALVRISDPTSDPTHAARLRKIHNYDGLPGGQGDPVKGGMRLTPILSSDTEAARALIAERVATKIRIKKSGTGEKTIYVNVIGSFEFKSNISIRLGPDAGVLRDLCKRALPERASEVIGIITAPTMPRLPASTKPEDLLRKDADYIITTPGFDAASGLYFAPIGSPIKVSTQPSQNEIQNAVELLKQPFLDFSFAASGENIDETNLDAEAKKKLAAEVSRSVAIYGTMIAATRRVLPTAPGIAFTSHGEGMSSGKTLISSFIIVIATGGEPVPVAFSPDFNEQEKQIIAYLLEGDGSLFLDEIAINTRFDSSTVAKIMTSSRFKGRLLGLTKPIEVSTRAMVVVNGNSLNMAGAIASRFLLACLNTELERPQDRSTSNYKIPELIPWAIEHRQEIVAAVHTIARAYLQECRKYSRTPPDVAKRRKVEGTRACGQCEFLRDAFLWTFPTLPDPFLGFKASTAASSTREDKAQILQMLYRKMGEEREFPTRDIYDMCREDEELSSLVQSALPKGHTLNSNSLGKWLWNQLADAIIDNLVMRRRQDRTRARYFSIEKMSISKKYD
jgi:hypothetical protein